MWRVFLMGVCLISAAKPKHRVVLFNQPQYEGIPEKILDYNAGVCDNFDVPIQVSSIKVHDNCVTLYAQQDCEGESATITNDIPRLTFHSASIKYCQ
ncbi:hypothetical protein Zmor_025990 [Zophobas morio]|uniref:Uncharacterized protein n=1 Tax=Zophobas morio TaxID=2755281 RepID=A0AA38M5M8_9CUCU|nr:hypothetical protein Zmor_025990 [Zophobas morio]